MPTQRHKGMVLSPCGQLLISTVILYGSIPKQNSVIFKCMTGKGKEDWIKK